MAKDDPTTEETEVESEESAEPAESSLRDDIESAITEHTEEETDEEEEQAEDAPAPEKSKAEDDPKKGEEGDVDKPDSGKTIGDEPGQPEGYNAPLGFSPEAREAWKDVPDTVKEQIHKREQDITEAMANTGEYRRTHTALTNLAQSYAPVLAAEGAETPMAAVEGLFKTVAELRMGTPQQTASKMAALINHYGIDINMLDSALAGQPMASPEETRMGQLLDQRLAPFQGLLDNQQTNTVESQNVVAEELATFAKDAEFLNDVRQDMADFIDVASKQGRSMGFPEAYERACAVNPAVSKVLAERAETTRLANAETTVAAKKNAASSIRSNSAESSIAASQNDGTIRGAIEEAWDNAQE